MPAGQGAPGGTCHEKPPNGQAVALMYGPLWRGSGLPSGRCFHDNKGKWYPDPGTLEVTADGEPRAGLCFADNGLGRAAGEGGQAPWWKAGTDRGRRRRSPPPWVMVAAHHGWPGWTVPLWRLEELLGVRCFIHSSFLSSSQQSIATFQVCSLAFGEVSLCQDPQLANGAARIQPQAWR